VLFTGKQLHDHVIQCCTRSEYNHIAVVIRRNGALALFEATSPGVGDCALDFYINSYYWTHFRKLFPRVVIRQIHTREGRGLTRAMRAELLKYTDEMTGRRFEINPIRYMETLLSIKHAEDFSAVFCSQLVAGAYQRMGLLSTHRHANDYLPRDFTASHSRHLDLLDSAWLGPERKVLFEEGAAGLGMGFGTLLPLSSVSALSARKPHWHWGMT